MNDPRLAFRALMAALLAAVSATVVWIWPDIPGQIIALWSAVFMAGVGFGEVFYDRNTVAVPKDATRAEVKEILEDAKPSG